jgi:tripartite-type tricarboxylate transporter receptor subunit TctC
VTRRTLHLIFGVLACALTASPAFAQYPDKPIRLVIPFPPGGGVDQASRIMSERLTQSLHQPVVFEYKPGADGQIASMAVIKSAPDGYTLYVGTSSGLSYVPAIRKSPPYDPVRDLAPVSSMFLVTFGLFVHPDVPAKSLPELVEYARANPGKLSYGTGSATSILATAELLANTKTAMVHIPFKGDAQALTELLSGRIQVVFGAPGIYMPHVQAGKLRVLATTSAARSPALPDAPTFAEVGLPALTVQAWGGVFAPAGLSTEIAERLSREITSALARPDVRERMEAIGFPPLGSTPAELGSMVTQQLEVWRRAVRAAGLAEE